MLEFTLASSNQHKIEELNKLFTDTSVTIVAPAKKIEVIEDGLSFEENAHKKAKAYYDEFGKPSVADDSGLLVESLPDELGIYSARFGGEGLDDKGRYELLLEKLKNEENRKAAFVCYLCFYFSPDEVFFFQGRLEGQISQEASGDQGFGYDPVFHASKNPGESLASNPVWKEANSHRALAVKAAREFFKNYK